MSLIGSLAWSRGVPRVPPLRGRPAAGRQQHVRRPGMHATPGVRTGPIRPGQDRRPPSSRPRSRVPSSAPAVPTASGSASASCSRTRRPDCSASSARAAPRTSTVPAFPSSEVRRRCVRCRADAAVRFDPSARCTACGASWDVPLAVWDLCAEMAAACTFIGMDALDHSLSEALGPQDAHWTCPDCGSVQTGSVCGVCNGD